METADKLREAREAANYTLAGAADLVGRALGVKVSRETVRRLEAGEKAPLSDPQLVVALFDLYERDTTVEAPEVSERWGDWIKRYERHAPRKKGPATRRNQSSPCLSGAQAA
jgi:hypothetical protein